MTKTETRNGKLRAAHDKLQQAVAEIASGDDWKRGCCMSFRSSTATASTTRWIRTRTVLAALGCFLAQRCGRHTRWYSDGMRRLLVALIVLLLVPLGSPVALADRARVSDANDTLGLLDIRSIAHRHDGRGRLVHTVRTFRRWRTRALPADDENYLGFLFESRSRKFGSDRFVWVRRSEQGHLYAELYQVLTHPNGEFLRRVPVWRPDRQSVRIAVRPRFLGRRFEDGYRWRAITSFEKGSEGPCRRDNEVSSFPTGRCTDAAPGYHRRGLRHNL